MSNNSAPLEDSEPERWIEETSEGTIVFKRTPRKKNRVSEEGHLDVVEAYHAATIFLKNIWHRAKEKKHFSETDFDYLEQFYGHFLVDPASIYDWRRCYLQLRGKIVPPNETDSSVDKDIISYSEAFQTLQIMAVWHYKDFGFNFPQFLSLLDSMSDPQTHDEDWNLWEQSCQRARSGETMGYE